MGLVCIQNSSLLVYSKSQKVSASYCLPFQHSRGKNQPVGRFRLPPACLGLIFFTRKREEMLKTDYILVIQEVYLSPAIN